MIPWPQIDAQLSRATGSPFRTKAARAIGGGCINQSHALEGGDGRRYFVKINRPDELPMFEAEAAGLEEIRGARTIRVPQAVAWGTTDDSAFLVLEYLPLEGRCNDERLGIELAALHRTTHSRFGWYRDNTIGSTPQRNAYADAWIDFWRERRLGYQLELAAHHGHGGTLQRRGEQLMGSLDKFFAGYSPAPALLHGDLWSGNYGALADGTPVIFDPAVYYGDREADLAMTELFGGFAPRFYAAYRDAYPLDPGYNTRKHLYNLYHVLNHLNLFGGGYRAQAEHLLGQLLSELK